MNKIHRLDLLIDSISYVREAVSYAQRETLRTPTTGSSPRLSSRRWDAGVGGCAAATRMKAEP